MESAMVELSDHGFGLPETDSIPMRHGLGRIVTDDSELTKISMRHGLGKIVTDDSELTKISMRHGFGRNFETPWTWHNFLKHHRTMSHFQTRYPSDHG